MDKELENVFSELFKLLDIEKKKIIYNALNKASNGSIEQQELENATKILTQDLIEKQTKLNTKKPEDLTEDEQYILSLNYINIDRSATKTYLKNNRLILDLKQKIKMIKTGKVIIVYTYSYDPTSIYYIKTKEIGDKLRENYNKYKNLKQVKIKEMNQQQHSYPIDRFSESIFMIKYNKKDKLIAPKDVEFDSEHKYKGKDGRIFNAIKIEVTIPTIAINKEIEIFTSFSLPTDIFEHDDPEDKSSFITTAARTTIMIQEEIYGSSLPQLNASCEELDIKSSKEKTIDPVEEDLKNIYYCRNTWVYKYEQNGAKKYTTTVTKC